MPQCFRVVLGGMAEYNTTLAFQLKSMSEDTVSGIWGRLGSEHYFYGFFNFHDYLVFIGFYASLYKGDKETFLKIFKNQFLGGFIPFDCLI